MTGPRVDDLGFFEALAAAMNARPAHYEVLGDTDLDLGIVMRDEHRPFRARLSFRGITCDGVTPLAEGEERQNHCWLEGDLQEWQAMVDDIVAHGRATGRHTLNSLTMVGDHIGVRGDDPMGIDRFFRFNQTLQDYFDEAAQVYATAAAGGC